MVGSALVRRLAQEECDVLTIGREQVDLTRQKETEEWMAVARPDAVFLSAGRVGGIHANDTYPADFLYDNLAIEANVIHAAHKIGVEKLLFLGSSCIYPREAAQPMTETALLTGPLEPTNEWYAIAKIAGIKLCQAYRRQHGRDFISAMPTNLYGPGDNFHPQNGHVPAALLRRFHEAKLNGAHEVTVWGTGRPRREFMYVEDAADACVHLMRHYADHSHINVGTGKEIAIADFAELVCATVGFEGRISFDSDRPDGTRRKVMDVTALRGLGWVAPTSLEIGLKRYYQWFLANAATIRQ
jgi:GDP-L-fucose synthase